MARVRLGPVVLVLAALVTVSCDRLTKHVAVTTLAGAPNRSYFADTVRVEYVENPGGFLSLGASLPPILRTGVFTVATGLALLGMVALVMRRTISPVAQLGLTLFAAGGVSNWLDRVLHGTVVDFLNVGVGPLRTGVFNVADVAILAGAAITLIAELRRQRS